MWIKAIFHTIKILVLINNSPTFEFNPSKALHQGDPLSPLLFNPLGQVLHHMLQQANYQKKYEEIHIECSTNTFTHLLFADDISITSIKRILLSFQLLSGLKINFYKSEIRTHNFSLCLGYKVGNWSLTYLEVQLGIRHNSIASGIHSSGNLITTSTTGRPSIETWRVN